MTTVHIVLGVAVVVVNLAAGLLGAYKWRKDEYSHVFWPILRTGQALVVIEALDGAVLLLMGQELPRLHLIYGLVPLGVQFIAEQLRVTSAQAILDQRGVSSARELDPDDAEHAALDILRTGGRRPGIARRRGALMRQLSLCIALLQAVL